MRALKRGDLKELAQVTQKNGRVSVQTQAEHVLTKGLKVKHIMNIHIETSDIWVEELQPKKVQHIPSTNK